MTFEELKQNYDLINSVNWEMTPEEAIALHLEWGPLRSQSYYNSRDKNNETVYFILDTWKKSPRLALVRRKGFDSEELFQSELPDHVAKEFMDGIGKNRGIYAVEGEIRNWLQKKLGLGV